MRVKTSVTIDERVLKAIDRATTAQRSRSRVIEDAVRKFLASHARTAREARDLQILNDSAEALNREMEDVLTYGRPSITVRARRTADTRRWP